MIRPLLPAVLLVTACSPTPAGPSACATPPRLWISVTPDYRAGTLCGLSTANDCLANDLAPTSGDTVLAAHGDQLVALNYAANGDDSVAVFDVTRQPPALRAQLPARCADDPPSIVNPRAWVTVGRDEGYVARRGQSRLARVDVGARTVRCPVDLAAFQGSAPGPQPVALLNVAGEVWVLLQRLGTDAQPHQSGLVVRVDPATDRAQDEDPAIEGMQGRALQFGNPVAMVADGDGALFASVGNYGVVGDGGVERMDALGATSVVVREQDVGGNIDAVLALDADRILLRVAGATSLDGSLAIDRTRLRVWSRSAHRVVGDDWMSVTGWLSAAPVLDDAGRVYVGDRGDAATRRGWGIRIFDAASGRERTTAPLRTSFEPYALLWH